MRIKKYSELIAKPKFKLFDIVRYNKKIFKVQKVITGFYVNYYNIEDDNEIIWKVSENSLEKVPDYELDAMKYNM